MRSNAARRIARQCQRGLFLRPQTHTVTARSFGQLWPHTHKKIRAASVDRLPCKMWLESGSSCSSACCWLRLFACGVRVPLQPWEPLQQVFYRTHSLLLARSLTHCAVRPPARLAAIKAKRRLSERLSADAGPSAQTRENHKLPSTLYSTSTTIKTGC